MFVDLVVSSVDIDARVAVEAAQCAEAAGFDGVWTYDHVSGAVLRGRSTLDVWTLLAAMATATNRITFGPLVVNATSRHPAHINTAVATLQQLSGGRLVLGLGAGAGPESPYSRELTMFGVKAHGASQRRTRVIETIETLRAIWRRESSFEGTQLRMEGVEAVAIPNPVPKIIVGANGPRMAELAGIYADGVNLHSWESDLTGLVAVARTAAPQRHLEISVEVPYDAAWFDPSSAERTRLKTIGVDRMQVRWFAGLGIDAITEAADLMNLSRSTNEPSTP